MTGLRGDGALIGLCGIRGGGAIAAGFRVGKGWTGFWKTAAGGAGRGAGLGAGIGCGRGSGLAAGFMGITF